MGCFCTGCGHEGDADEVEPRWSFGVYAGRLCADCCMKYRDHCGLDFGQGDQAELEEEGEIIDGD